MILLMNPVACTSGVLFIDFLTIHQPFVISEESSDTVPRKRFYEIIGEDNTLIKKEIL